MAQNNKWPYGNEVYTPDMVNHPGWTEALVPPCATRPPRQYIIPGHHPYLPPPHKMGRVRINGSIKLRVDYTDHYGHVRTFDIIPGVTYEIDAFSNTRGLCHFVGKVVDFECKEGVYEVLKPPHSISISALIVDTSDMYESNLLRIRVENIERMLPILGTDQLNPDMASNVAIKDPFVRKEIDEFVTMAQAGTPITHPVDGDDGVTTVDDNNGSSSSATPDDTTIGTSLDDYLEP